MTHFVNPKEGEGDLVPYLVDLTKGGTDYSFEGIVNLMVAGERRLEPRNRWVAYAAVLKAVISAQTSVESYSLRFGNLARESQSAGVGIREWRELLLLMARSRDVASATTLPQLNEERPCPPNGPTVALVESPGGSHVRALPDPYVNLPIHTAPDVRPFPWHSCQCARNVGLTPGEPVKPVSRSLGLPTQPLELAARPANA
jgi:hypothetical protein